LLATPRGVGAIGGTLLAGAVLAAVVFNFQIFPRGTAPAANMAADAPGSRVAFTSLAQQHSNFCQLQRSIVMSYTDDMRLQGACCNPLDMAKYQHQVAGLRAFANNPDIAPDPYDIPVPLAKRLFAYDDTITLTSTQQAVYDRAISMTEDKAPCCCQCWRWYMTRGLAKSLIAQHSMDAPTVARIIDLANGCGGKLGAITTPSVPSP
jgi:hypothetical protein